MTGVRGSAPLTSPSVTEASFTRNAGRSWSRVPLPSRSQRLHNASASSTSIPSCARPYLSSPTYRDQLPSLSRRQKNLGIKMELDGWGLPRPKSTGIAGGEGLPGQPPDVRGPSEQTLGPQPMMVFTASIMGSSEQLWWDGIPNEFLHSIILAKTSVILHSPSRATHITHLACLCH